jgi:hypothetical protein
MTATEFEHGGHTVQFMEAIRLSRARSNFSFSASGVFANNPASAAISRRFSSSMSSGRSAALRMPTPTSRPFSCR